MKKIPIGLQIMNRGVTHIINIKPKRLIFLIAFAAVVVVGLTVAIAESGAAKFFELKIEVNPKDGGSVSPEGDITYDMGTKVEVTATANDGYWFTGWTGASEAKTRVVTIVMDSNQTLTANFEKIVIVRGTFTDSRDRKKYRTVKIGDLTWMAENLNYSEYNTPTCYEDNWINCKKYGQLYSWRGAMGACPAGWRLPTREDWNNLIEIAGGDTKASTKLKSTTGWNDNGTGTDDFGFSAMPSGFDIGCKVEGFGGAGSLGHWWSATGKDANNAWGVFIISGMREAAFDTCFRLSVRCVQ